MHFFWIGTTFWATRPSLRTRVEIGCTHHKCNLICRFGSWNFCDLFRKYRSRTFCLKYYRPGKTEACVKMRLKKQRATRALCTQCFRFDTAMIALLQNFHQPERQFGFCIFQWAHKEGNKYSVSPNWSNYCMITTRYWSRLVHSIGKNWQRRRRWQHDGYLKMK